MGQHFSARRLDSLVIVGPGEQRQRALFGNGRDDLFAVPAESEKAGIKVGAVFQIFIDRRFLDAQHDMEQGAVDSGLGHVPCFYKFTELLIIKIIIQLPADSVCQVPGHVHIARKGLGPFVQQLVF